MLRGLRARDDGGREPRADDAQERERGGLYTSMKSGGWHILITVNDYQDRSLGQPLSAAPITIPGDKFAISGINARWSNSENSALDNTWWHSIQMVNRCVSLLDLSRRRKHWSFGQAFLPRGNSRRYFCQWYGSTNRTGQPTLATRLLVGSSCSTTIHFQSTLFKQKNSTEIQNLENRVKNLRVQVTDRLT